MRNGRNHLHRLVREQLLEIGSEVETKIVGENLHEDAAFRLERETIAFWRGAGISLANLSKGGEGASGYKHTPEAIAKTVSFHTGRKRSSETRARIAEKARDRKVDPARIEAMAVVNRGKKRVFTREHKDKIGAASRGRKMPSHVAKALRDSHLGKPRIQTPETRAKMSAARKGRKFGPLTESHKAAISAGNKGKKKTPEHRAKISEARRRCAKKN